MFAFKTFPAKIEYNPPGEDRPTYQVEVLGYLDLGTCTLSQGAITLVCFRQSEHWLAGQDDFGGINFLLTDEFEEKFKDFKLKEE